jgi:hypothetical protein
MRKSSPAPESKHPVVKAAIITGSLGLIGAIIIASSNWSCLQRADRAFQKGSGQNDQPTLASPPTLAPMKFYPTTGIAGNTERVGELRKELGLRGLDPLESGKVLSEAPSGTYFWIYPFNYSLSDLQAGEFEKSEVRQVNIYASVHFEVHKDSVGRISLLGYASREAATNIAGLDGTREYNLVVSPMPWGVCDTLVSIPKERFVSAKRRTVQLPQRDFVVVMDVVVK